MENLATRIRQELNTYQSEVAARLQEFYRQGLISQAELKKIVFNAEITGKAVVEALATQEQYTEEATEIYVYSLFDRYKTQIEKEIRLIEEQQKSVEVSINGQKIPIHFEDEEGKLILPSQTDKEIVIDLLKKCLDIPVTSVKITVGTMRRDIDLTLKELPSRLNNKFHEIKAEGNNQRMKSTYQHFGAAISQLVNSDYPEDAKELSKSKLLEEMYKRLGKQIKEVQEKPRNPSFWSRWFNQDDDQGDIKKQ